MTEAETGAASGSMNGERDALMLVVDHAATHLGHIDVTRDLALAREAGS